MRLLTINGRPNFKNVSDRQINWNGKSKSLFQEEVKKYLHPHWNKCIVYEEFPVYGTRYTLDFFNATKKVAIEVQGTQHTKFVKYFQRTEFDYLKQLKIDEFKRKFCEMNGIDLIEIFYNEKNQLSKEYFDKLNI